MTTITDNLQAVRARIAAAAREAQRDASEVALLAVTKSVDAQWIEQAWHDGQQRFGESYAQEAVPKITRLARLEIEWHFIGPIQSNKTQGIAQHFAWVHSIEREKIAVRLDAARPSSLPPLNVCIQVNISGEYTKSGVAPGKEFALAACIARLPRLRLRGLMAIPEPSTDTTLQRARYALLRELKERLCRAGHRLDTLSMGMSDDLEAAIAEGATFVRVGTAIFGARAESRAS